MLHLAPIWSTITVQQFPGILKHFDVKQNCSLAIYSRSILSSTTSTRFYEHILFSLPVGCHISFIFVALPVLRSISQDLIITGYNGKRQTHCSWPASGHIGAPLTFSSASISNEHQQFLHLFFSCFVPHSISYFRTHLCLVLSWLFFAVTNLSTATTP